MKHLDTFKTYKKDSVIEESLNTKKSFAMTTQVQDSIKKLCESMLHEEAKKFHEDEDKSHTYENYVKECGDYMKECMNECMESWKMQEGLKEGIFSAKPAGNVEEAKKDAIKAARAFIEKHGRLTDPKKLSDERVIQLMKGYASHGTDKFSSEPNKQAAEFWRSYKHLFK